MVPGTVHTDLLQNKLISDPFYGDEESKLQWISHCRWEYQMQFQVPTPNKNERLLLRFDGVDTYADIYLNDFLILQTDNMFRYYEVDITDMVQNQNTLRAVFHPADSVAAKLAAEARPLQRPCENNRHYVRKAQYHFGWDWAPKLSTCGFWKPVYLVMGEEPKPAASSRLSPVRLVEEEDSIGRSFYFTVKGQPTYMKGANWIPADVFLPRITREKYRDLLVAAREANFNMLRVWGGGIYESDDFYELCDSLGIYVWQDFMFAGAMYPAQAAFLHNVREEIKQQVLRLRKYRCIVLWCGNNEIDEAWHNWGWQKQFSISPADSALLWNEYQQLFHVLIPQVLQELDPERPYIPSSPRYGWGRKESLHSGDAHYWGLWWGLFPVDTLKTTVPRFMSEFGMQAMPNLESVQAFAARDDFDTASVVMKLHQKHPTGYQNLARYLAMEGLHPNDFPSYITATQELQHRALETGIRSQMNSKGRCMGTLIWQFNDCWPVCSWSVVDYYGRKKKAWYTLRKWYGQEPRLSK